MLNLIDLEFPYPLDVACELIPMPSRGALYQFLFKHKAEFPGRYRNGKGYAQRFLTGREILRIREMTINEANAARYARVGRPPGRAAAPAIARIMRMANGTA